MASLLQNVQSATVKASENHAGGNSEHASVVSSEIKSNVKDEQSVSEQVINKPNSKNYFNKKTILGSLAGLAVLGGSILAVKKYSSKAVAQESEKLTPEIIKNKINSTEARVAELREIIRENYLSKKNHIIKELNQFGEFDYKVPFENAKQLREKIELLEKNSASSVENSTKIINENKAIINSKMEKLSSNERWNRLNQLREQLRKILDDKSASVEQKNIANEKIPLVNDLLINMIYPEEAAAYKGIYGLTDKQTYELVTTEFPTGDAFMKEFDRIKDKEIPFSFDTMEKRFSHNGSLSEHDLFPEETETIQINEKRIKDINVAIKTAKDLYEKYSGKIKALANEFRQMPETQELKSLTKQIKELKNSLSEAA